MCLDGFSDGFLISVKWIRRFNCFGCYNFFYNSRSRPLQTTTMNEWTNKQTSERMKNRKIEKNKRWHTAFVCESFASRKKKTSTQSNAESAWCAAHKSPNMKLHLRLSLSLPHFASVCGYLILFLRFFFLYSFISFSLRLICICNCNCNLHLSLSDSREYYWENTMCSLSNIFCCAINGARANGNESQSIVLVILAVVSLHFFFNSFG